MDKRNEIGLELWFLILYLYIPSFYCERCLKEQWQNGCDVWCGKEGGGAVVRFSCTAPSFAWKN
jgi:hypothetical protein